MRRFLSRVFGAMIDAVVGIVIVEGTVLFALVLLVKLASHIMDCPDGEHRGPAGASRHQSVKRTTSSPAVLGSLEHIPL